VCKADVRQVLHYEGYGKELMKRFKVSPDAWVQLVKQLAFHKMFGRPGVTYESCQTRKYQQGRTEVIRSASNESKAWAEAMLDPDATVSVEASGWDDAERRGRMWSARRCSDVRLHDTCSMRPGRAKERASIGTCMD
jgi:carnitine O-acetyltransferase